MKISMAKLDIDGLYLLSTSVLPSVKKASVVTETTSIYNERSHILHTSRGRYLGPFGHCFKSIGDIMCIYVRVCVCVLCLRFAMQKNIKKHTQIVFMVFWDMHTFMCGGLTHY